MPKAMLHIAFGIAPEADQLGNDEGILGIGFDLADEHIPHGAGLDRVEQNDVVADHPAQYGERKCFYTEALS